MCRGLHAATDPDRSRLRRGAGPHRGSRSRSGRHRRFDALRVRLRRIHLLLRRRIAEPRGAGDRAADRFRLARMQRPPRHLHHARAGRTAIMYLAATKYKIGQIDSALLLIRGTPAEVSPMARRSALGYASNIYLKAGILDTAYMYAKELISDKKEHIAIGYQVLLSQELRKYIHPDSLNQYIYDYRDILETYYDENMSQLAINQQALFNYQTHERHRIKAEKSNQILRACIIGFVFIILLLGVIALSLKNRNKNNIIKLHKALENINQLEHSLELTQEKTTKPDDLDIDITISKQESDNETIQNLRNRLRLRNCLNLIQ